jgi:glycerol-1-phosphate dehydrogenase [NAD(P)+]
MEGRCFNGKHVSHGFKVAIGTLVSTAMLEFLLENDIENIDPAACAAAWPSKEEQAAKIREMFAGRPHHMERALAQSAEKYLPPSGIEKELTLLRDQWPDLKEKIRSQIFTYSEVKERLRLAGAPYEPEMIGISRARLKETFLLIPYMRSRYTAVDVILRAGLMDKADARLFGPGGIWEIN